MRKAKRIRIFVAGVMTAIVFTLLPAAAFAHDARTDALLKPEGASSLPMFAILTVCTVAAAAVGAYVLFRAHKK